MNVDLGGKTTWIYPNPAKNEAKILIHMEKAGEIQAIVYNLVGEKISELQESMPNGQGQILVWNCSDVAPGIYYVRIMIDGRLKETQKLAILR